MVFKDIFWVYPSALSQRFCDDIIEFSRNKKEELALISSMGEKQNLNEKDLKELKNVRDSNITWLEEPWIYNEIYPFLNDANKSAGWNFEWDVSEKCQFTKYGKNQYYHWHCDSFEKPFDDPNDQKLNGKIRKLSITCSLSNPEDYSGGLLEFDSRNRSDGKPNIIKCEQVLPRGSICVFPSHVWHRVSPVTKGTRYSLVVWNCGYPFK
jgi:PKHD-type hydroxylase